MRKDFKILDHTADIGITAYGDDMKQAFVNAAQGLFSLITQPDNIKETQHQDIALTAPDRESLLVAWLNELIYLFDTDNLVFKRFVITRLSDTQIEARSYGEKVDKTRHTIKREVKAATHHLLKVSRDDGCQVQVLFDI